LASIKNRGKGKWFVRVFLGRAADRQKFHDKLIHGGRKDADAYARKIGGGARCGHARRTAQPEKSGGLNPRLLPRQVARGERQTLRAQVHLRLLHD
jgi:hypothetical protein